MTQLELAAKAALHLRNRLQTPRQSSLFDDVLFTTFEQAECLLALAEAGQAWIEAQASRSAGGKRGGEARANKLSKKKRSAIASAAAKKRWQSKE